MKLILCRLKKRHTALRLPAIRRLRIAATISSSVKSDCWEIKANSQSACSSNGEILPPVGLAAILPVSSQRCSHFTAELALTSKQPAASRRDAPAITASSRRNRKSREQGFGIDLPPKIESMPRDSLIRVRLRIPDSTQPRYALIRIDWTSSPCLTMPAFLTAGRRRLLTLKLQMIIAPRAVTSSSIIANTAAGRLTTVSTGSALAGQDVNRTLFHCSAGCRAHCSA